MRRTLCVLAVSLCWACAAAAQVAPPAPALVLGGAVQPMLRAGTTVQLRLEELLTTKGKRLRVGQHFRLSVIEPVAVDGRIVIPVDALAVGEIIEVRNKGMWGKSGHLTATLLYVSVNGRQIRLTGTFDDKGVTGTGGVVAAAALLPIAGFFTTGTSAKIEAGAQIKGFVGEDIPLVFSAQARPQPMPVPVTVPDAPATPVAPDALPPTNSTLLQGTTKAEP